MAFSFIGDKVKIGVIGSKGWEDYQTLIRKLTVEIEDWKINNPDENKIAFIHQGTTASENMVTEYVGKIEDFMRQKKVIVSDKIFRVPSKRDQFAKDFELINSDIDRLIIFAKEPCARSRNAATIAETLNVPYTYIKG